MELIIKPYYALPCALETFKINGIDADDMLFQESNCDVEPEYAGECRCGCHKFTANKDPEFAKKAMEKYNLTYEEYLEVCDKLEDALYVGECSWCV